LNIIEYDCISLHSKIVLILYLKMLLLLFIELLLKFVCDCEWSLWWKVKMILLNSSSGTH